MRLVFAGTPAAAVVSLDALLASRHDVAAVVTRPDAPAGRGLKVAASPVAQRAEQVGLDVLRPARPSEPEFLARLAQIAPDCCPVTAYGALIPRAALDLPRHGWVNLHFSVLPAWRGAAPVAHAILHGDEITGATTFRLVAELDAGPVFGVVTEPIRDRDTAGDLLDRLSVSGAELLVATLDGIESGELEARPQPAQGVSLAPKLRRDDARVSWKHPALAIDRLIRACTPAPGAWTTWDGATLKLWPVARIAPTGLSGRGGPDPGGPGPGGPGPGGPDPGGPDPGRPGLGRRDPGPGEVLVEGQRVLVGTGTTPVQLGDVQPEGKRRMAAADWARGLRPAGRTLVLD
ncbi:MAG TPA: methionyl-tRNA formyltransferase [Streptosporangiaceae bacterium]|nr:methionyl-tRNA formyltransferase [Streptosporangiaceae bacterium]